MEGERGMKKHTEKPPSPKPFILHKGPSAMFAALLFFVVMMILSLALWVIFIKWAVAL